MLTLVERPENKELCFITRLNERKRLGTVYWHPRRDVSLRNKVADYGDFNTQYLRDQFELSKGQAASIFDHLKRSEVDTSNQKAFFKVKRHIAESLFSEMNLEGTNEVFQNTFEPNVDKYSGHVLVIGSTGQGKTYYVAQRILRNLNGPKSRRRNFIVFSAEWFADKTLDVLKKERYRQNVTGVDCGEHAYKESRWESEGEFFLNEIKMKVDNAPRGTILVFDDARESVSPDNVRKLIDKLLRVGRHAGLTCMIILHNLHSGSWSSQAYSSVKELVTFPRSSKNKLINFLNKDLGLPVAEARDHVFHFAQTGRTMTVRFHAPEALIGPKLIRLF